MKFNVKHFQKVHEDNRSIVLKHPKHGHQIVIAKEKLSPAMKAHFASEEQHLSQGGQVANLKENYHPEKLKPKNFNEGGACYADGGDVQIPGVTDYVPEVPTNEEVAQQKIEQNQKAYEQSVEDLKKNFPTESPEMIERMALNSAQNKIADIEQSAKEREASEQAKLGFEAKKNQFLSNVAPTAQNLPQALNQTPNPQAMPQGMGFNPYSGLMGDIGKVGKAYQQEAAAQGAMGREQLGVEQEQRAAQQKLIDDFTARTQNVRQSIQDTLDDIKQNHINQNQYLENMSVPGKIQTAIGLIMGGIGAGMTGHPNMAAQFLQNQINRDIASQQANLGKKESLLSGYMKQFNNEREALAMTQATMQMQYASKLREAADRQMEPMAKARAMQQAAQFEMQALPIMRQVALMQTMSQGQGGNVAPEMAIQMLASEHERPGLMKELQTAQNMAKQKDNLMTAFNQVAALNTPANRLLSPLQTSSKIEATWEPLLAQLVKDSEGRITPQDTEMIRTFKPAITDDAKTLKFKATKLNNFVSEKMNFPGLRPYGIDPSKFSHFNQLGQSRILEQAPVAPGAR